MPVGSIKLKILLVIKLPQVKSRYLVPLCVIFSMYWRLNIIIWFDLRVITFLTGTTAVKTVAHSPKPQNNLTILFFDSKKNTKLVFFTYFSGLENMLSTFHCLRLNNYVSGRRGTVEL